MPNKDAVILPYKLIDNEWSKLSRSAKDVYVSIKRMMGKTNSRRVLCTSWNYIPFGHSDLVSPMSKETLQKALKELQQAGLIELKIPGKFPNRKNVFKLIKYRK